jgi:LysM repeat protein
VTESPTGRVSPVESTGRLTWSPVTGHDAVRVIDHSWIQIGRVVILLAAVLVTWRILDWQETKYTESARQTAVQYAAEKGPDISFPTDNAAISLPTIRPVAPRATALPEELADPDTIDLLAPPGDTGPTEYTVVAGDILGQIADRYRVPVEALMEVNEIDDPDQIQVGQVLKIPNPSRQVPGSGGSPDSYTVAEGDTLQGIADRFGIDIDVLQRLNGIEDVDAIFPGTVLEMP